MRRENPLCFLVGKRLIVKREAIVSGKQERDVVHHECPIFNQY